MNIDQKECTLNIMEEVANGEGSQSILEYIRAHITPEGILPKDISIQDAFFTTKEDYEISVIDGFFDNIVHRHENDKASEQLIQGLTLASEEKFDEAIQLVHDYFKGNMQTSAYAVINGIQGWLVERRRELKLNNLVYFAYLLVSNTKNIEVLKFGLSIFELFDLSEEAAIEDVIMTTALCDEFTQFCLFAISSWKNKNDLVFSMAKNVYGWGRINAVRELMPSSEAIRSWLLQEGCKNSIMPQYTAYDVAIKLDIKSILKEPNLSHDTYLGLGHIVDALIDSYGGDSSIKQLDDIEDYADILESYVYHGTKQMLCFKDYTYLWSVLIQYESADPGEYRDSSKAMLEELFYAPHCNDVISQAIMDGEGFNIASYLGLDVVNAAIALIEKDPIKNSDYLTYAFKGTKEEIFYVIGLYEELECWSQLEKGPIREISFKERFSNHYELLWEVIRKCKCYIGLGETLILLGLCSVFDRARKEARDVLKAWIKNGYKPSGKMQKALTNMEKEEANSMEK